MDYDYDMDDFDSVDWSEYFEKYSTLDFDEESES